MRTWTKTRDSDDHENPIKPFPHRPFLEAIDAEFEFQRSQGRQLFVLPKTRRMIQTTYWLSKINHVAEFHPDVEVYFQSRREAAAMKLVKRAFDNADSQPDWMKEALALKPRWSKKPPTLHYGNGTVGYGVPEGQNSIRGEGAAAVLSDELAFQPDARGSWAGIKPALGSNGWFVGLSTPNGKEFFYALVMDEESTVPD